LRKALPERFSGYRFRVISEKNATDGNFRNGDVFCQGKCVVLAVDNKASIK